jgi:hypothetical protein
MAGDCSGCEGTAAMFDEVHYRRENRDSQVAACTLAFPATSGMRRKDAGVNLCESLPIMKTSQSGGFWQPALLHPNPLPIIPQS